MHMVFSFKNYQILKVFFKIANLYTRKVKTKNARAEPGLKRTYMTGAQFPQLPRDLKHGG